MRNVDWCEAFELVRSTVRHALLCGQTAHGLDLSRNVGDLPVTHLQGCKVYLQGLCTATLTGCPLHDEARA